ncbi:MAG: ornithine--oxo-acid transaminase [Rhodospirillales bacterium RIFCSPLOWO2_12_FULL_58_28]|nr:MAG: ornithine--oxo-acid transaminase [Rhodospirillales bacterium RIFCSPLOWO2_12_FULL_58_28]
MSRQDEIIAQAEKYGANNYLPLPLVISRAEGVWAWDEDQNKYMDCLSSYSALNQGHRHPAIIKALIEQAGKVTLTSRAFHNMRMGAFLEKLCRLSSMEMALPMNTGVEAVETAIKAARKWGYRIKGIKDGRAEIIVCNNNFHGRTTTVVGFSSEPRYRDGFGPFAPGFRLIDFGDIGQLEAAITPDTAAFMVEPIQGEGGIVVPPEGYLAAAKKICRQNNVLFVLDEIQTGLGRTGKLFCHQHEAGAEPDVLIVGKALGGGVYPVSAMLSSREVLGVFTPGDHGSTFGGNPLASAVGEAALDVIVNERLAEKAERSGRYLMKRLASINGGAIKEVRGKGLLIGIEIKQSAGPARPYCERLMKLGVLVKETHVRVIRLAPPLIITMEEIDWLAERMQMVLGN